MAVRVLDCNGSGSTSGVIAGIDWVTQNHAPNAVANMSLGGGLSSALNTAVANAITAGVTFAVAAGNAMRMRATRHRRARLPRSRSARRPAPMRAASFSNFGNCVDINAPGVSITSSWNTSDVATNTISGTSMASPHVAGAAALYLSGQSGCDADGMCRTRCAQAKRDQRDAIPGLPAGTPNMLLYIGFMGVGGAPPPSNPSREASRRRAAINLHVHEHVDGRDRVRCRGTSVTAQLASTARRYQHTFARPDRTSTVTLDGHSDASDGQASDEQRRVLQPEEVPVAAIGVRVEFHHFNAVRSDSGVRVVTLTTRL